MQKVLKMTECRRPSRGAAMILANFLIYGENRVRNLAVARIEAEFSKKRANSEELP